MFVGESGVMRMVERTAQVMRNSPGVEPRSLGVIDLDTLQRYMNFWFAISLDLFGGEISSNAASYFAAGLKGRAHEARHADHVAKTGTYALDVERDGRLETQDIPLRNAMNAVLRDEYIEDSQRGVERFNKVLADHGIDYAFKLPSPRFHRKVGAYARLSAAPDGTIVSAEEWQRRSSEWLPTDADREFVKALMSQPVTEPGKMANWIAPPKRGVKGRPVDFEYVRFG